MPVAPLDAPALRRRRDLLALDFQTTAQVEDLDTILGQPRAEAAVRFGIGMEQPGYNIFALGTPGTGKRFLTLHYLRLQAAARPAPPDVCYVHNFETPDQPRLLLLPAGRGAALRTDMERLAGEIRGAITTAFESEDFHARREAIDDEFNQRWIKEIARIDEQARKDGLTLIQTGMGLAFVPIRGDQVLKPDEFAALPEEEQRRLQHRIHQLQEELQPVRRQRPAWEREKRERVRDLGREVSSHVVDHLLEETRGRFAEIPGVLAYLDAVRLDIIGHASDLAEPEEMSLAALVGRAGTQLSTRRYEVNLLVDHSQSVGAPVVEEDNPTHDNLVGRIEHAAQFGTLVTDFTLLKAGALHRANGGYLVLEAHRLLRAPMAWEALKRALRSGQLRLQSLGQALGLTTTVSLEPEPLPLAVQVVLLGEPLVYYLLGALDPDFAELFKVSADFAQETVVTGEEEARYIRLIASLIRKEKLLPFDRTAVARVLEQSSRLAEHQEKLSLHVGGILDLLREADYWAGQEPAAIVGAAHVERAITARIHRQDRLREQIYDEIRRGTLAIDTVGRKPGQINGLSVIVLGGFSFARPTRITARVRLGAGDVVDIQREVELGGPIHSKGVFTLGAYLRARYAPDCPLSLWASLVFEQSYGPVEGDSASLAELCALLSAIADVPLSQGIAVTGGINQHGEVQAVGGINEKIEGFFDVCRARGLTGTQGVIIPAANTPHLMVREDVLEAGAAGRYRVWPVRTVDEAIELLTGMAPTEREDGRFPQGSFNGLVESTLVTLAERRREYTSPREEPAALPG